MSTARVSLTPEQRDILAAADQVLASGEGEFVGHGRDGLRIEPAPDYYDAEVPAPVPLDPEKIRNEAFEAGVDWANQGNRLPAVPLDPSNPDDLRRAAKAATAFYSRRGISAHAVAAVVSDMFSEADRLDRERAEQAQDAEDRRLSEAVADEVWSREESAWHIAQKAAQATIERIRAERARASAEGS